MRPTVKKKPAKYASGQQIGARAKHVWVCTVCGAQTEKKPAENITTQCRGSGTRAHTAQFQHFASRAEAKRYHQLRLLERGGYIRELRCQPVFHLDAPGGGHIGDYIADFAYLDGKLDKLDVLRDEWVYEDVKGRGAPLNELAAWKMKHAEKQYGIRINIIRR
jgi:hypothetical protein